VLDAYGDDIDPELINAGKIPSPKLLARPTSTTPELSESS
jgi:hypothetical protein